jgi:hypothetical protein
MVVEFRIRVKGSGLLAALGKGETYPMRMGGGRVLLNSMSGFGALTGIKIRWQEDGKYENEGLPHEWRVARQG